MIRKHDLWKGINWTTEPYRDRTREHNTGLGGGGHLCRTYNTRQLLWWQPSFKLNRAMQGIKILKTEHSRQPDTLQAQREQKRRKIGSFLICAWACTTLCNLYSSKNGNSRNTSNANCWTYLMRHSKQHNAANHKKVLASISDICTSLRIHTSYHTKYSFRRKERVVGFWYMSAATLMSITFRLIATMSSTELIPAMHLPIPVHIARALLSCFLNLDVLWPTGILRLPQSVTAWRNWNMLTIEYENEMNNTRLNRIAAFIGDFSEEIVAPPPISMTIR